MAVDGPPPVWFLLGLAGFFLLMYVGVAMAWFVDTRSKWEAIFWPLILSFGCLAFAIVGPVMLVRDFYRAVRGKT